MALTLNKLHPFLMKHMSIRSIMWSPRFEDPLQSKAEIEAIRGTPEYDRKVNSPIKAAHKSATCSMFRDPLVTRFQNIITYHNQAQLGTIIMNDTFAKIKETQLKKVYDSKSERADHIETNPIVIIKEAVENARPMMALEKVKVGSVVYYVPTPITTFKSEFEAIRWIHAAAQDRDTSDTTNLIADALAKEIVDAYNSVGRAVTKKHEHHKLCEQNRAYAHYRRTK